MEAGFATKLRLTAAVLGCVGRKDLCARFRAVNPGTHFDLERSHKWLQGRAMPRSPQVYDDWAKVLRTTRSGAWLLSCTVEAFLEEICALYDADPDTLRRRAMEQGGDPPGPGPVRPDTQGVYLCGTYACYSMAWSPYFRGEVIRGALAVRAAPRPGQLAATYTESLLGTTVRFEGTVRLAGRTVHLAVHDPSPLYMSLFQPGPPASVLCGIMSGTTVVGPEPRPSATRLVVVRVPADATPSNRYLTPHPGSIAADLLALGLRLTEREEVDGLVRRFLVGAGGSALEQVTASEQAQLSSVLDRAYLSAGRAEAAAPLQ